MPRPYKRTYTPMTPDPNGVFEDQTAGGAGSLTLDGVGVSGGVWTASDGLAHQISLESAGNLSAVTFTITGTDADGKAISEDVTGPNANTVESLKYFLTITSIAVDGAVGTNVEGGPVDEAVSPMYILNFSNSDFETSIFCTVTGTADYTIEVSGTNPWDSSSTMNWFDHDTIAGETGSVSGNIIVPVTAMRSKFNSYTAGATLTTEAIQSRR